MDDLETRFHPTPAEKILHSGPQSTSTDYRVTYPDSYISVIIDGNRFQFLDNFVANDDRGGKQAAIALSHAIAEVLKQITDRVMPLMIRVLGNPEWLSDAYYDANIIPNRANFGWFLEGFNSAEALVEFVAIDVRLTTPIYHMRDAVGLLKANLLDPHCNLLLFGGTIDDKVISILTSNLPATHRLILFSNCPGGSHTLSSMLPSLPHFSFPSIFLPTERRPTIPRPKPVIYRNAHGARIDPPINPMESIVTWLRTQKFCNYYYLQGQCPDQRCKSRHDVRLDGEQLDGLRYLARGLPCRHSNLCRDPACYAGHMCPLPTCKQECCRFYADMHVSDRRIVREE